MATRSRAMGQWLRPAGTIAGVGLGAIVILLILPRLVDFSSAYEALGELSWPWLAALVSVAVLNLVTFAPPLMATLPGLSFRPALAVTLSSTASTYVAPGGAAVGIALSFAMLRAWRIRERDATLAVAVGSAANIMMTFGTPAVAIALLALEGGSNPALRTASVAGLTVFSLMLLGCIAGLRSDRQAHALGDIAAGGASLALRIVRRGPVAWGGESFVRFRRDAVGLLRARWYWIAGATLAGHLSVYLVLLVTLRALGVDADEVSLAESFAAWSLVRVIAALPVTPGGIGLVEVGLTGSLLAFGGPQGEVVAAVLVYRALTVGPPLLLGALFAATWRRHNPGWEPRAS